MSWRLFAMPRFAQAHR